MAVGNAGLAARLQTERTFADQFKTFLRRYFYFCMSLVMTAIIIAGFSRTVDVALFHADPKRPILLWMHGAAFSTWMVLFIVQSGLVRIRRVSIHRTLGYFGAALAATMVVLGTVITVVMSRFDLVVLHQKGPDAFMAIPFVDMIFFGTCIALAIYWKGKPEYHRRLVFMATCHLMDAGIGRFDFWFNHSIFYLGLDAIIVLGMLRDRFVDGRIHQVYKYGLPAAAVLQVIAVYLWRGNPAWWQSVTHALLGI